MGEGDEDVGEDDGGVGVDRRHTMMALAAFRRHRERGGEGPPFLLFFLDLLPRWEKGFPSILWPPWQRRGEIRSEIGSVSLSLSVSMFQILPFHHFLNSRRSVTPIALKF